MDLRIGVEGVLEQVVASILVNVSKWAVDDRADARVDAVRYFPAIGEAVVLSADGLDNGQGSCAAGGAAVGAAGDHVVVCGAGAIYVRYS